MKAPRPLVLPLSLLALSALTAPATAQRSGDGFLFHPPSIVINLHGGVGTADANGEVFDFVSERLTLDRGDFLGGMGGASVYIRVHDRVDLSVNGSFIGRKTGSEFRNWVDQDDLPIEQDTYFFRVPLTAGARVYVLPRGQSVGSLAWIPSRIAPYVGASGGVVWYRFRQSGAFVDFEDLGVFNDDITSDGWAPAAQGTLGFDFAVSPRIGLTAETGYLWSSADLSDDFESFDPIDLSGFTGTIGFSLRL